MNTVQEAVVEGEKEVQSQSSRPIAQW